MQIEVIANVNEARSDQMAGKTVVVIDVLRATSNMVVGLAHGCVGIIPVETIQETVKWQQPGDLRGGERNCKRPAGFDLGNSPFEYMGEEIRGKRIIMTTTNGTRAMQKTCKAHTVLAGALLNASSCARVALGLRRDLVLLCSGTQDVFSLEDGLCAGMIASEMFRLANGEKIAINDFGLAMMGCYEHHRDRLHEALLNSANGQRLVKLGFSDDIGYCAQTNRYDLVPVLVDGMLVPYH